MDIKVKLLIVDIILFFFISIKMVTTAARFVRMDGKAFKLIEFEFTSSKENLLDLIKNLDEKNIERVKENTRDDYAFMFAAYIGVALLCYIARDYVYDSSWKTAFSIMAKIQIIPWILDIFENSNINKWLKEWHNNKNDLSNLNINTNLKVHLWASIAKWILALIPAIFAIIVLLLAGCNCF